MYCERAIRYENKKENTRQQLKQIYGKNNQKIKMAGLIFGAFMYNEQNWFSCEICHAELFLKVMGFYCFSI